MRVPVWADTDIYCCYSYGLFSSLSTLKTTDMVPQLPKIVQYMLQSLKSMDGVKVHYTAEENNVLANFDLDDTADDLEADNNDDFAG